MCACDHDCIIYYEDSEGNCIITEICLPINVSLKHILVGELQIIKIMDTTNIIHIQTTDYNNDILEEEHIYITLTMPLRLL